MDTEANERIQGARARLDAVCDEVSRVYIGTNVALERMLIALLARGHVLLEGVPGIAKTTLAKAFADALGVTVRRIQFTPDLLPSDITGTYVLSPKDGTFSFRRGPVFANVVLADELNRAPPKTQAALLEAMQEQQVTIEGDGFALPRPFIVVATQNPIDLEGTYPLPEAQIDRFLVHVAMGYPKREHEVAMLRAHEANASEARPVLDEQALLELQGLARGIHVEADLYDYAVGLSEHTRSDPRVLLGASPRATLGLVQASKAMALLRGRGYVTPDDLRALAPAVLAHRLILRDDVAGDPTAREEVVRSAVARVSYRKAVQPV
ncbi:MAG: MoxR family ATPase [Deltaproteobacteria bacterium]|nr:MoxR family ATPase [Deltaproteobacteria bacterium]